MASPALATPAAVEQHESKLVDAGLAAADVRSLTLLYVQYLHALGRKARVRHRVVATASIYFHRFFHTHTFLEHDPLLVAPTALWMASKIEECAISPKLIVREMADLALRGNTYEVEHLLAAEYVLLEVLLPYGLAVTHPHAPLAQLFADADLREHVGAERADCLVQTATFLVNDACRTPDVALCYAPRIVALSCAHAAGLLEHVPLAGLLPTPSAAELDAIEHVAASLLTLYESLHHSGSGAAGSHTGSHPVATAAASGAQARDALALAHERLTDVWAGRLDPMPAAEAVQPASGAGTLVVVS